MKLDHRIKNLVLQKTTGLSKEQLFLKGENLKLSLKEKIEYKEFISRIESGEPIEYIIEEANFYLLDFYIDNRALIPKDDTEIVVEKVLEENFEILIDIWTGSSCIAIAILKNKDIQKCFVVDLYEKALEVSKINIEKHNLENKIIQVHWDLLLKINNENEYCLKEKNIWDGKKVVITANLPYIKDGDYSNMDKEVIDFEPNSALYWGEKTWFELYEKLIFQAIQMKSEYNINSITLFIEIGFDQKNIAEKFLKKIKLRFNVFEDNNWISRCIKAFL